MAGVKTIYVVDPRGIQEGTGVIVRKEVPKSHTLQKDGVVREFGKYPAAQKYLKEMFETGGEAGSKRRRGPGLQPVREFFVVENLPRVQVAPTVIRKVTVDPNHTDMRQYGKKKTFETKDEAIAFRNKLFNESIDSLTKVRDNIRITSDRNRVSNNDRISEENHSEQAA